MKLALFLHDKLCQNEKQHECNDFCFDEDGNIDISYIRLAEKLLKEFDEKQIRKFVEILVTPKADLMGEK